MRINGRRGGGVIEPSVPLCTGRREKEEEKIKRRSERSCACSWTSLLPAQCASSVLFYEDCSMNEVKHKGLHIEQQKIIEFFICFNFFPFFYSMSLRTLSFLVCCEFF